LAFFSKKGGATMNINEARKLIQAVKTIARVRGKEWRWEPRVGEWCWWQPISRRLQKRYRLGETFLITLAGDDKVKLGIGIIWAKVCECIPLLHWEELESILEEMGYWLEIGKPLNEYIKLGTMKVGCSIYQKGVTEYEATLYRLIVFVTKLDTRQEAVTAAVLALAEKVGK